LVNILNKNNMITVINRKQEIESQMQECWAIIRQKENELEALRELLRQPVEWDEGTTKRIVMDNANIVNLTINAKALIDYLFENDTIEVVKVDDVAYIYVNYILPEHEAILLANGAEIETNPDI